VAVYPAKKEEKEIVFIGGQFREKLSLYIFKKGGSVLTKFTKYRLAGELNTTVSGKLLYLFLLDTVDADGKIIIPQRWVSEALGFSRGTVSKNFRRLYRRGYIDIVPQYHEDGGRAANKICVL